MAYSENSYVGNGSNKNFSITFPYISKTHVQVFVANALKTSGVDYSWLNDTTIQFVTAPGNGVNVIIRRSSNRNARLVDYQDASVLNEATLDLDGNQTLFVAQEAFDYVDRAVTEGAFGGVAPSASNIGVDPSGNLASTDVQTALVEHQTDIDAIVTVNNSQASSISTLQSQSTALQSARRNRLINGGMLFDQRWSGAAVNLTTSNQYIVDRWAVSLGAALVGTITAQRLQTGDASAPWAIRLLKSAGAFAGNIVVTQVIESFDSMDLPGQTCVLKFRARRGSSFAGTISALVIMGTGSDQGVNGATGATWTGYSTATPIAATTPGTGFTDYFASVAIPAGTNEIAIQLVMTNTSASGSANNWVEFSNVQFYKGNTNLAWEFRPVAEELVLCQRYYERGSSMWARNFTAGAADISVPVYFKVSKRVNPTCAVQVGALTVVTTEGLTCTQNAISAGGFYNPGTYTADAEL